ncbi:MAG: GMC family oxidoreductase [Acidobacteria bacterium]|nr:GMC family oxidoreductase [Acidobacteriota bacterium]
MFISAPASTHPYDCCVVGSGPAGITLALELARANRTVLMFESGAARDVRQDMPGAVGFGHLGVDHWNRHSIRVLGGTSRVWSGRCLTLMERDFDNPATGVAWPIRRSELVPHYRRAAGILERDESIVDAEWPWCPGFVRRPFSEQAPVRFGDRYADALEESPAIHVALGSSVVGLDANPARTAVEELQYFHHPSGTTRRLAVGASRTVVLAGGGIGNAQLLLQPRSDGAVPVGNESGLVGRFLMEHPHFHGAAELVIDEAHDSNELVLAANDEYATRYGLLGSTVICREPTAGHPLAEHLAREHGKGFHHYTCEIMAEMMPSAGNRVFLTGERDAAGFYRPGVRCVFGAPDLVNVETTLRLLGDSLIASGKGRVRIVNDRLYRRAAGGGHIMGTTRMGRDKATSVVDRDCRVHGYHNLFVAGSSVFPTGGYANPTLTILALALRLADRLAADES